MTSRRQTKQKKAILSELEESHLLSAQEINQAVSHVDESTIYRNLKRLEEDGVLRRVQTDTEAKYELVEKNKVHDHFICNDCEEVKVIYLEEDTIKSQLPTSGSFSVTVRGICDNCTQKL